MEQRAWRGGGLRSFRRGQPSSPPSFPPSQGLQKSIPVSRQLPRHRRMKSPHGGGLAPRKPSTSEEGGDWLLRIFLVGTENSKGSVDIANFGRGHM